MMGMLLPLGIEKGKEFKPDPETVPSWRQRRGSAGLDHRQGDNERHALVDGQPMGPSLPSDQHQDQIPLDGPELL